MLVAIKLRFVVKNFNFCGNFLFLTKISIFHKKLYFWQTFQFLINISIFDQINYFVKIITFLQNMSKHFQSASKFNPTSSTQPNIFYNKTVFQHQHLFHSSAENVVCKMPRSPKVFLINQALLMFHFFRSKSSFEKKNQNTSCKWAR